MNEYAAVIQMAIEDNPQATPAQLTKAIIQSLAIASRIMQRIPPQQAASGLILSPTQATPSKVIAMPDPNALSKAMPVEYGSGQYGVGVEPPVAGASDIGMPADYDHWESRAGRHDGPERLRQALASKLPAFIEISVPGIDVPVRLNLGLSAPGYPMSFVRVSYMVQGQDLGPTVTVTTAEKLFFPEAILEDIREQARCSYAKEKKAITPRVIPMAPPTDADIARLAVDGDRGVHPADVMKAQEDAREWASKRGPQWAEQR